ncbi:hypothetical protein [Adhaeribacter radiodurans]|uniref:Uncharacterized protein n=1 Tax=Adhaeribacter radiodurans TaxID=2745197 RepID=A0A7L7LBD6_9BACT|nr:hypothetical protein [Adhaeribacter radiodurans]QMU30146.1 hypothetical protein HUW48_19870 [Adhaeribacter radiodurans]
MFRNPHQELDNVLTLINKYPRSTVNINDLSTAHEGLIFEEGELLPILERLIKDGYVGRQIHTSGNTTVYLTFDGKYFLAEGGYIEKHKKERYIAWWIKAKTIATVLYSVAVLGVAIWAVWVEFYNDK